jgi:hypothetical protein
MQLVTLLLRFTFFFISLEQIIKEKAPLSLHSAIALCVVFEIASNVVAVT